MIKLYEKKDDKLVCLLCPNSCALKNGNFGLCNIRKRVDDEIVNIYSGIISSQSIDPIEKKPLYHFYPNSQIFSIGFYGCTLKCQFCQNYSISQNIPYHHNKISPQDFVAFLINQNISKIAFTYSEPLLHFEWVYEVSKICRESNIKTVLVTNGYLNEFPSSEILKHIDATNIDLKSSKNSFYQNITNGKIEPVKQFIKLAFLMKVHIEVTTLVITETNDNIEECIEISSFISSLSDDIPFHISRYHPSYKFNKEPTNVKTIENWINESKKRLNFVYAGNVNFGNDTFCKNCGEILIKRRLYSINNINLDGKGCCRKCLTFNNIIN